MRYYILDPEVAGGWGKNTVFTRTPGRPTMVHKLHYNFDGWLGDELLETVPCFIVTQKLADLIQAARATGAEFDHVEVSKSKQFEDFYPDRRLPQFVWLKVNGIAGKDDFGLSDRHRLVVSERILEILKSRPFSQCGVSPYQECDDRRSNSS